MSSNDELSIRAYEEWEAGNLEKAFDLFKCAAERDDGIAQQNLGYFFDEGIGVKADKKKAEFWYTKAAQNGHTSAYMNIAILRIEEGEFVLAGDLLGKAIAFGDGNAALNLAKLYLDGSLPSKNDEARKNLEFVLNSELVTEAAVEEAQELLDKFDKK